MNLYRHWRWIVLSASILVSAGFMMRPLALKELATQADLILLGTVQSETVSKDPEGRIFTRIEFQITDCWKGHPSSNPFPITLAGGTLGDRRVVVPGQADLKLGESALLFLVLNQRGEGVIMGLSQGKFRVWNDPKTGERRAANIFWGNSSETSALRSTGSRLLLNDLKHQVAVCLQ